LLNFPTFFSAETTTLEALLDLWRLLAEPKFTFGLRLELPMCLSLVFRGLNLALTWLLDPLVDFPKIVLLKDLFT
jgi:hypothetical protein